LKVNCPRCKAECDLSEDFLSKVKDWVCAACGYESDPEKERRRCEKRDECLVKPVAKSTCI